MNPLTKALLMPRALSSPTPGTTVRLAPRFAPAYYELGVVLNVQGRKDEARLAFRTARDLDPNSPFGRAAVEALKTLGEGG